MGITAPENALAVGESSTNIDARVGACIQRRRRQLGADIDAIADEIGVPVMRFAAIEAGTVRPTAHELYDLARALGLSITDLFREAIPPGYRRA